MSCKGIDAFPFLLVTLSECKIASHMFRLVFNVAVMSSLAATISGCEPRARYAAVQPSRETQAEQPKHVLGPGYTIADLTNNPVPATIRRGPVSTNSELARYDRKLIDTIQLRWDKLTHEGASKPKPGEVIIEFHLHADGHVSSFQVAHNTSDETAALSCLKAVQESAPFGPWPPIMQELVTNGVRELHFTFRF